MEKEPSTFELIGVLILMCIVGIALKLTGMVDWPWQLVTLPAWLPAIVVAAYSSFLFAVRAIASAWRR